MVCGLAVLSFYGTHEKKLQVLAAMAVVTSAVTVAETLEVAILEGVISSLHSACPSKLSPSFTLGAARMHITRNVLFEYTIPCTNIVQSSTHFMLFVVLYVSFVI